MKNFDELRIYSDYLRSIGQFSASFLFDSRFERAIFPWLEESPLQKILAPKIQNARGDGSGWNLRNLFSPVMKTSRGHGFWNPGEEYAYSNLTGKGNGYFMNGNGTSYFIDDIGNSYFFGNIGNGYIGGYGPYHRGYGYGQRY